MAGRDDGLRKRRVVETFALNYIGSGHRAQRQGGGGEMGMSEDQSAGSSEFERQPVPDHALLGFRKFLGMYAGEHCAGTELMIGPLFVAAGVSAFDLVDGLDRRQRVGRAELGVVVCAHCHPCPADPVLPAREDLRSPSGHAVRPRQRCHVLFSGGFHDHGLRHGDGCLVSIRHAGPRRQVAQQLGLGTRRFCRRARYLVGGGLWLRNGGPDGQHCIALDGAGVRRLRHHRPAAVYRGHAGGSAFAV